MKRGAAALAVVLSACTVFQSRPPEARTYRERDRDYELTDDPKYRERDRELGRDDERERDRERREQIEVRVTEVDDDHESRPYAQPLRYEAQLSCRSRFREGSRDFAKKGFADNGRFTLSYPGECESSAELSVDVLPDYNRCRASRRDERRTSVYPGKRVDIEVRCESESYRAKLEALLVLDCHESSSKVERAGDHEFWVRGCGRSVRMRCFETETDHDLECEHGRVHRD